MRNTCSPLPRLISRRGFTLVELMVTIAIIGIIAGMSLGAMQWARRFAAEEKTKATIAKLDAIISARMEAYRTRRLPITILPNTLPKTAAWLKLNALRDAMRMELPDCAWDVQNGPMRLPTAFDASGNPVIYELPITTLSREPAPHKYYRSQGVWVDPNGNESYDPAQCLYLIVASKSADLEQFSQNEIGTVGPPGQEKRVFIDGWGKPIMWLRWAPGYLPVSKTTGNPTGIDTMQTGDYKAYYDPVPPHSNSRPDDHDPFDSRRADPTAYNLTPLIYSAGPDGLYGLYLGSVKLGFVYPDPANWNGHIRPCEPVGSIPLLGTPDPNTTATPYSDNITNHQIEM
jgi:prepilin-type N-terminal cleavage/methylation domain-containing protein